MEREQEYLVQVKELPSAKNRAAGVLQKWIKKHDRLHIKESHVQGMIDEFELKMSEINNNYNHRNKFTLNVRDSLHDKSKDKVISSSGVFTVHLDAIKHYWEDYLS